jgi:hypothetical protein
MSVRFGKIGPSSSTVPKTIDPVRHDKEIPLLGKLSYRRVRMPESVFIRESLSIDSYYIYPAAITI